MACGSPRSAAVKTLRDTPGGGWLRGEQVGYVENFGPFPSTARGERRVFFIFTFFKKKFTEIYFSF